MALHLQYPRERLSQLNCSLKLAPYVKITSFQYSWKIYADLQCTLRQSRHSFALIIRLRGYEIYIPFGLKKNLKLQLKRLIPVFFHWTIQLTKVTNMKYNCQLQVRLVRTMRTMYGSRFSTWRKLKGLSSWRQIHLNVNAASRVVGVAVRDKTQAEKEASPKWVNGSTNLHQVFRWVPLAGHSPPRPVPWS